MSSLELEKHILNKKNKNKLHLKKKVQIKLEVFQQEK